MEKYVLVHNHFSAPAFSNMLKYAWYASIGLSPNREVLQNTKQICFPEDTRQTICSCDMPAFARCSWCKAFKCFKCYYIDFHPLICKLYSN